MIRLNKQKIDEILHMYEPSARYLLQAEMVFPVLEAELKFPNKPIYLINTSGIHHINNTEATIISNQAAFLLYREALLSRAEGFPHLAENDIKDLYDSMFIKKQDVRFKQFASARQGESYKLRIEHKKARKTNGVYFFWFDLSIEDFFDSKAVGGIKL